MSQQYIINMGRSIELFGNSDNNNYTGNIFSFYPSISYSVVDNIYKFITSDDKKVNNININDDDLILKILFSFVSLNLHIYFLLQLLLYFLIKI